MSYQQSAELSQPIIGACDLPSPFVASQLPAIFIFPLLVVTSIGRDQFDPAPLPSLSERVRVVASVGDHPFRLLPLPAFRPGDTDFRERGVRKRNFCRRDTFQPNSQRNTVTVTQYHPLRALAALGFTDCQAHLFHRRGAAVQEGLVPDEQALCVKGPSNVRQARSQTPSSSSCFSRRQQVDGDGNSLGKNRQAAPSAVPTGCPRNRHGSSPSYAPACHAFVGARETMVR